MCGLLGTRLLASDQTITKFTFSWCCSVDRSSCLILKQHINIFISQPGNCLCTKRSASRRVLRASCASAISLGLWSEWQQIFPPFNGSYSVWKKSFLLLVKTEHLPNLALFKISTTRISCWKGEEKVLRSTWKMQLKISDGEDMFHHPHCSISGDEVSADGHLLRASGNVHISTVNLQNSPSRTKRSPDWCCGDVTSLFMRRSVVTKLYKIIQLYYKFTCTLNFRKSLEIRLA